VCVNFVYTWKNIDDARHDYNDVYELCLLTLLMNIACSSNVVDSVTFNASYRVTSIDILINRAN